MPKIFIPTPLRTYAEGHDSVVCEGATVFIAQRFVVKWVFKINPAAIGRITVILPIVIVTARSMMINHIKNHR